MCFNCIIISDNKVSSSIVKGLVKKMLSNPHGYAIYSYVYPVQTQKLIRTLNFRKALIALLKLSKSSNAYAHLHFRYATTGAISIDNVHLWDIHNYLISHNGYVSSYAYTSHISPTNHIIDSDSKRFVHSEEFQKALESKDFNAMWNHAMDKGFYGFMLITSKDFEEIYIMANKPFYFLKYKGLTIISNESIDSDLSTIRDGYGIYRYNYHNGNLERIVKPKLELERRVLYSPVKYSIYGYDDDYSYYFRYLDDYGNYGNDDKADDDEADDEAKDCNNTFTVYEWIRCKTKKFKAKHKPKKNKKNKNKNKNKYEDYVFF